MWRMAIDQPVELKADPVAVRGRLGSVGSHSVLDFLPGGNVVSMGYNHRQVLVGGENDDAGRQVWTCTYRHGWQVTLPNIMVWQPSVNDSREWCSVAVVCLENGPPVPQVGEGWVERPVFNERALAATKLPSKLGLQGARMLGTSALIMPPRTTWNIAERELAGNDWREVSGASERVLQTANHWLRTGVIAVGKHPL